MNDTLVIRPEFRSFMRRFLRAVAPAIALLLILAATTGRAVAQEPNQPIGEASAGPLAIGQSIEALRGGLAAPFVLSDELQIFPGLDGYAMTVDGVTHAFVATGERQDDRVELIIIVNDQFRTADGLGPGSSVADGVQAYGPASLEWFPDQRGIEVVRFADQPAVLEFRTSDFGGPRAGVYAEGARTTEEFTETARVSSVWIDCRDRACPESILADPGDGDDEPLFPDSDDSADTLPATGLDSDETLAAFGFSLVGVGFLAHVARRRA